MIFIPIIGLCMTAGLLAWRFLPVGTLYGRRIYLHEWPRWRVNLRLQRIDDRIKAAMKFTGDARARALARLLLKYGGEPFGPGDGILEALTATGVDSTLAALQGMLRDAPEVSAVPVCRGIIAAARQGNPSRLWKSALFDVLAERRLADGHHWRMRDQALLALDRERGIDILTSSPGFEPGSPVLHTRLHALYLADAFVPRDRLEALSLVYTDTSRELDGDQIHFLILWAAHDPVNARELLFRMAGQEQRNATAAAEALLGLDNLPHPRLGVDDFVSRVGREKVEPEVRAVWLADIHYCYPMSVGDLADFFRSDSADLWDEVCQALAAIGAPRHAGMLRAAGLLFGPEGPPVSQAERDEMLAADEFRLSQSITDLAGAWPECENLDLLKLMYVLEHPEPFRSITAGQGTARE